MTKANFMKNFTDENSGTMFHNHFTVYSCFDKQGRPFTWEHTTVKGTFQSESYACIDWEADGMPIYTAKELDGMEVLNYDVDLVNDCLILYLDI